MSIRIIIRETDGLNESVHTLHIDEPVAVAETFAASARGFVIDEKNRAKLDELLLELATFVARERSIVQTINLAFHIAGNRERS